MSLSIQDYDDAIQGLVDDLWVLGPELLAVMLYGSIAQGTANPGRSDVDASVFLRGAAFQDRKAFLAALETMVSSCRGLARHGKLYDHAFGYVARDELHPYMTAYLPSLLPPRPGCAVEEVRFVVGEDLRGSIPDAPRWEAGLIESLRCFVYPFAGYLLRGEWSSEDRSVVASVLQSIRKFVPPVACAAAGAPAVAADAHRTLAGLFPDLDVAVLDEVGALKDAGDQLPPSEVLRGLLKRCMVLCEDLHRRTTKGAVR